MLFSSWVIFLFHSVGQKYNSLPAPAHKTKHEFEEAALIITEINYVIWIHL